jgi:hypothetical protein
VADVQEVDILLKTVADTAGATQVHQTLTATQQAANSALLCGGGGVLPMPLVLLLI